MRKGLKVVSFGVLLSLLVSTAAACGSQKSTTGTSTGSGTAGSTKPAAPVTISVEIFDRSNAPEGGGTVTDNYVTRYIADNFSKNTNISINWVPIPRSQEVDKLQVLMAGGTAPDICFTYDKNIMFNYAKNGGLTEITDELLNKNGPNLRKYLGDNVLDYGKYSGKQFSIVAKRAMLAEHNSWIRKDLLDKLGLKMPTTTQELYEVLKTVKEKDPGNVGKDKVVAFGMHGSTTGTARMNYLHLLLSFADPNASEEDYNVLPDFAFSGAKEGLKFINKMYNEGMISKDFALDDTSKKFNEDVTMGRTVFFTEDVNKPLGSAADGLLSNLQKNVPDAKLVPIDVFKNSAGKYRKSIYSPAGMYIMIPKTSKNPAEAIKYLDWMSQNFLSLRYGAEGVHYKIQDEIPVVIDTAKSAKDLWTAVDIFLLVNGTELGSLEKNIKAEAARKAPHQDLAVQGINIALKDGISKLGFDVPIEAEMKNGGNLKKIEQELIIKSIAAKPEDFEKTYEEINKKWLSSGGQQVIDEKRVAYKNMKKK